MPDHVCENFNEDGHQFRLALSFVNRVVFRGARIRLSTTGLDGEGEFLGGAGLGAFKGHVLGEMREACGDVPCFIAGADRDVNGERGALGFREMGVGKAWAGWEIVGGVGGRHAATLNFKTQNSKVNEEEDSPQRRGGRRGAQSQSSKTFLFALPPRSSATSAPLR